MTPDASTGHASELIQLRVLGVTYRALLVGRAQLGTPHKEGAYRMGEVDASRCEIRLDRDLPATQMQATLFHEVVHAALEAVGVELDERDVCATSATLFAVLVDNPPLMDVLYAAVATPQIKREAWHTYPLDTDPAHQLSPDCWCTPTAVQYRLGTQYVHRDGGVSG